MKLNIKVLALIILLFSNGIGLQVPAEFEKSEIKTLTTALNSYHVPNFFPNKTIDDINHIIVLAQEALSDQQAQNILKKTVVNIQSKFKGDNNYIPKILNELIYRASQVKAQKISRGHIQKPNLVKKVVPLQPKNLNVPAEQQIVATQLYIGLDVKTHNNSGQIIDWQEPIDIMWEQLGNENFIANDYLHITIAWLKSENKISPQDIQKVERALAHAEEILKIVFPNGITDVAFLDQAILLGLNNKSTIAFRVAPSSELKKLQDIILKFLSFENVGPIKYSNFSIETPLHLSLGKVKETGDKKELADLVAQLAAPEGARASQGQKFSINSFRLTYSVKGQPWQEKMSYKF